MFASIGSRFRAKPKLLAQEHWKSSELVIINKLRNRHQNESDSIRTALESSQTGRTSDQNLTAINLNLY